ncbi:ABC transporter substrate-binding protein [Nonomuraea thailandensis]
MIGLRKVTAFAVAAVLMLAGCSTTTGGAGGGDPAAAGDKLTAAGTYPIESLDPHGAQGATTGTQLAAQAIFSRLVRPTSDGRVEGDLAEKWEAGATAAEWTFHLRSGVTFSDGKPVAAADVVASFERMMSLDGPNAANFPDYKMTATAETEVKLTAPPPTRRSPASSACSTSSRAPSRPRTPRSSSIPSVPARSPWTGSRPARCCR